MAECVECGAEYPHARRMLGYETCMECGEADAQARIAHDKKCIVPTHSKGTMTICTSKEQVRGIYAKHWVK